MIHDTYDKSAVPERFSDIVASDERRPSIGHRIISGITGVMLLLATGLIILLLVLWGTPSAKNALPLGRASEERLIGYGRR